MRKTWAIALLLAPAIGIAEERTDGFQPEAGTALLTEAANSEISAALASKASGEPVASSEFMVAAANPYAVLAGKNVLSAGGTAADALVAVQTVLGLVEPQSSGLGGGAFLVWYDAETGEVTTLDGRETAPLAATPKLFLNDEGEPLGFFDAVLSGRSVGVPGVPALLTEAHAKWGNQKWSLLLEPAQELATEGFEVSPRLSAMVTRDAERLMSDPTTAAYFLPGGQPLEAGVTLQNPEYAATLAEFARSGAAAFHDPHSEIGTKILDRVQQNLAAPGVLSRTDLTRYTAKERPAVCVTYRAHEVCGMGPPSSGALAVGQILGLLDNFDLSALGPDDPESWRLIGDASRLAFADRGRYVADSDFVPVPVEGMLATSYLSDRADLLKSGAALPEVSAGKPEFDHALLWADDDDRSQPSTTHISIVDSYGNIASMTSSVENAFGSRMMAAGFLLNNQLTDFSFRSHRDGIPVANRAEPGKRPRSSMSPTIVLKDGKPVMVVGSPGGSRIIPYVAKTIIAHLDWGMDAQAALDLPHKVNRFGTYDLEAGTPAEAMKPQLEAMGFETNIRDLNSGLHAIVLSDTGLSGGADLRREGIVLGE